MNRILVASNPFATRFVRPGALEFRFDNAVEKTGHDQTDCDRWESRLNDVVDDLHRHRVGLLVGHHGSGKSTLLHALTPRLNSRFEGVNHVQFCHEPTQNVAARLLARHRMLQQLNGQIKHLPRGGLLILDGAEQLARLDFRRLCRQVRRRGLALLATSHGPISNVPILHRTVVTPQLVHGLTAELIEQAPDVIRQRVQQWLSNHPIEAAENVRDLFFELYDVVHEAALPTTITLPTTSLSSSA